ncbi:MAG: HAD family hydrolase [Lachnospiraceae bacterium]|nr:HAD family hydrolase [Lachnospiraceae bacterium]
MKETMLIFDLDGTLWDSSQPVAESWNEVFERRGSSLHLTAEDIRNVMGKTMEEIARTILPVYDEAGKALFAECETYEVDYISIHGGTLYEGVEETLKKLKDDGYRLAIVSNCQSGYIGAFLKSMKMGEYFCDIEEWGNTLKPKDENIRLVMERNNCTRAIYIGDTQKDMDSARGAGIPFIHAAYGFGQTALPDGVIYAFDELPEAVKTIGGDK